MASKGGYTVIHAAAETGQLAAIPRASLTSDLLRARNDHGDTPLHAAAYEGHLDQVPPALLTAGNLGARNYDGVTPVRIAVSRGYIEQLPASVRPKPAGMFTRLLHKVGLVRGP